jgi:hypothetical protein
MPMFCSWKRSGRRWIWLRAPREHTEHWSLHRGVRIVKSTDECLESAIGKYILEP